MAELNISKIVGERLKGWGTSVVDGFLNVKRFGGESIDYFAKKNGDENNKFLVKKAVEGNEAVRKDQLENLLHRL